MEKSVRSLIFKRAWNTCKIYKKHNIAFSFGTELKSCFRIAKLIGYKNYKPTASEK
jgi:hypothetical protein